MAFSLRALLDNPNGGQVLSVVLGLGLLVVIDIVFIAHIVDSAANGRDNWWIGLGPVAGSFPILFRLTSYLRSRNAR